MTDIIETQDDTEKKSAQTSLQVGIRMQQGEHAGQPMYSNFTAVQGGQGVIFVDFGFLEPQAMQALARMSRSSEKKPETVGARMTCRMAISVDAAANLSRQLNQLLHPKAPTAVAEAGADVTVQ